MASVASRSTSTTASKSPSRSDRGIGRPMTVSPTAAIVTAPLTGTISTGGWPHGPLAQRQQRAERNSQHQRGDPEAEGPGAGEARPGRWRRCVVRPAHGNARCTNQYVDRHTTTKDTADMTPARHREDAR